MRSAQETEDVLKRIRKARVARVVGGKSAEKLCCRVDDMLMRVHEQAAQQKEEQELASHEDSLIMKEKKAKISEKYEKKSKKTA